MFRAIWPLLVVLSLCPLMPSELRGLEPLPERLVVLTFDDSVRSHFTVVRPLLLEHGFGATFFVTEGFDFLDNKRDYMTWEQIAQLDHDGFEIGNHTRDHLAITPETIAQLPEQLESIRSRCLKNGIPAPVSFAYPGNSITPAALPILKDHGILFARRGGAPEHPYKTGNGFAYEPGFDHPLLIPSAGDARPDWEVENFRRAVLQAREGRIAVLQFHGVPDQAHPWVHTEPERFTAFMNYLAESGCTVIALRDLARYVDAEVVPRNHQEIILDRQRTLATGKSRDNARKPTPGSDMEYWLRNMVFDHQFNLAEISAATGMSFSEIQDALIRFDLLNPQIGSQTGFRVLPYPGGRHPRIGFRDGAIRPQRETKCSVFTPWADGGYVVVDVPEAIWMDMETDPELLYLAHTHVPTRWSRQQIDIEPLEWSRQPNGVLQSERRLPNGVSFGALVTPQADSVLMEIWITNGSAQLLTGLRVQNCVMLKAAPQFNALTTDNRFFDEPYAACRNAAGDRWVITAWEPFHRTGGNSLCPCLHSDPQFPDCPPGETRRIRGMLTFYEGTDIRRELARLEQTGWREE
jgi:peptidoglycan/xylan/chitin deacetylase (PgdA/CDA1 family)